MIRVHRAVHMTGRAANRVYVIPLATSVAALGLFAFIVLGVVAFGSPAHACVFDTDCEIGSQCLKQDGSLQGFCVGGMNPGNANDRRPTRDPLDLTGKRGNTCSFDTDCGIGGRCFKSSGSLHGTCM